MENHSAPEHRVCASYHAGVKDLVPNRLVEEAVVGNAGGGAVTVRDPFRLEEQGFPETLRRGDDELIAPLLLEEALDPGGAVEERKVQIVGDLDVVGINRPGSHGAASTYTYLLYGVATEQN